MAGTNAHVNNGGHFDSGIGELTFEEFDNTAKYEGLLGHMVYLNVPDPDDESSIKWVNAKIVKHDGDGVFTVKRKVDGESEKQKVEFKNLMLVNDSYESDLCNLPEVHEPAIISNIGQRFMEGNYFTSMGASLIFVNPGEREKYLDKYKADVEWFERYSSKEADLGNDPHIYAITQLAYDAMCFYNIPYSIQVSGEAGTGKTECVNSIIDYLLYRSYQAPEPLPPGLDAAKTLDHRIRNAGLVLESFGNAYAHSNPTSTRFGKFTKICFKESHLVKAQIDTFLLEKTRVLRAGENERSFNVFYQLLAGRDSAASFKKFLKHLKLGTKPENYLLLNQDGMRMSPCGPDPASNAYGTEEDAVRFDMLVEAMTIVGISSTRMQAVFQVVAGILFFGNLMYVEETVDGYDEPVAIVENPEMLERVANALSVDVYALNNLLTERCLPTRIPGEEPISIRMTAVDAAHTRDSTCKAIYSALFSFLKKIINESLANEQEIGAEMDTGLDNEMVESQHDCFVGILDVCGLCNHEMNEFEHLLINYANEVLHHSFQTDVFDVEVALLEQENIPTKAFDFEVNTNAPCLELLCSPERSVFSLLEEFSAADVYDGDSRFLHDMHKAQKFRSESSHIVPLPNNEQKYSFCVQHYCGPVHYFMFPAYVEQNMGMKGNAWTLKNRDESPSDLPDFLNSSENKDIVLLTDHLHGISQRMGARVNVELETQTQLAVQQVSAINTILASTSCLHVQCVKPNTTGSSEVFENELVAAQLRSSHTVQACQVAKLSYPIRISFAQIWDALGDLQDEVDQIFIGQNDNLLVSCMVLSYNFPHTAYKIGESMIFFQGPYIEAVAELLRGPQTEEDVDILLHSLAESLIEVSAAYTQVKKVDEDMDEVHVAFATLKAADKTFLDKIEKARQETPLKEVLEGRLDTLKEDIDNHAHIMKKLDQIYENTVTALEDARVQASYGFGEDTGIICEDIDECIDFLVRSPPFPISSITCFCPLYPLISFCSLASYNIQLIPCHLISFNLTPITSNSARLILPDPPHGNSAAQSGGSQQISR